MRILAIGVGITLVLLFALVWLAGRGIFGSPEEAGEFSATRRPDAALASVEQDRQDAAGADGANPDTVAFLG